MDILRENGMKRCKCSNCLTSYGYLDTPYCPNCGRKMTGFKKNEESFQRKSGRKSAKRI